MRGEKSVVYFNNLLENPDKCFEINLSGDYGSVYKKFR